MPVNIRPTGQMLPQCEGIWFADLEFQGGPTESRSVDSIALRAGMVRGAGGLRAVSVVCAAGSVGTP